jgi:NADH-quinone oxidoreductase subunit C
MSAAVLIEALLAIGGKSASQPQGYPAVALTPGQLPDAARLAKERGFMIMDVFGLDWLTYPGHRGKRFTVSYNLYHLETNSRLFLRVALDDGESVPSVTGIWPGANFLEREVYDLFGITFSGHPDLRKLLTPDELDGHPLRKDFPLGETPTLFNEGRFLDPAAFRAGLTGKDTGLTGFRGGARKGVKSGE